MRVRGMEEHTFEFRFTVRGKGKDDF